MNLEPFVNTLNVLNYDKTISTVNHIYEILLQDVKEKESYIVSDCDKEMLMLIEFNQEIVLETITFHASNGNNLIKTKSSQPKLISIYKMNNISLDFNDISSIKPNKSIECNNQMLNMGHTVKLRNDIQNAIKFSKVRYLVIYIQSNHGDTKRTFLNGITIEGTVKQQNINIDAFDPIGYWHREMKDKNETTDLSESRVCQRHLDVIKFKYFPVINHAAIKINNTSMIPLITNDSSQNNNNLTFTKITSKTDRGAHILNLFVKSGVIQKILYDYKYKDYNTLIEIIEQQTKDIRICSNYLREGLCQKRQQYFNGYAVATKSRIYVHIENRSDMEILSTLIHELAHMAPSEGHGIGFIQQQSEIGHFIYESMRKKIAFYKSGNKIITSRTDRQNMQSKKRSIYRMMNDETVPQSNPKRQRVTISSNININNPPTPSVIQLHSTTDTLPSALNNQSRYGSQQLNDKPSHLKYKKKHHNIYDRHNNRKMNISEHPFIPLHASANTISFVSKNEPITNSLSSHHYRMTSHFGSRWKESERKESESSQQPLPSDNSSFESNSKSSTNAIHDMDAAHRRNSNENACCDPSTHNNGLQRSQSHTYSNDMECHEFEPIQSQNNDENRLHDRSNNDGCFDTLIGIVLILIFYCFIMSSIVLAPVFINVLNLMQFVKEYGIYGLILLLCVRMCVNYRHH